MAKFVFAYHGGKRFSSKEEGQAHMVRWRQWTGSLGPALVDPGVAVGKSITVSAMGVVDNGGANPISGVSMVEADTIEAATEMARRCPHLDIEGSIEIAEVMQMEM